MACSDDLIGVGASRDVSSSMKESDIQSLFTKYVRDNHRTTAAWELKLKKNGEALSFAGDFQPQQLPSLLKAKHGCVYRKLSDIDPGLKPFDAMQVCQSPAYVVVVWYVPREEKVAYWIDIDQFMTEARESKRKSLTRARASEIASKIHSL